jgi:histidine triad (HIT) family protein
MDEAGADAVKHIFQTIPTLEKELGLEGGYRVIINQGENGGQAVHHLHVHLLGGEKLKDF